MDDVERLRNHLVGAVQRALRMCNDFVLHFPGDEPSLVLAVLAREQSDVPFDLLHVSLSGSGEAAPRRLAKHLGLNLIERRVVAAEAERERAALGRRGIAPSPGNVAFGLMAREARLHSARLLLAHGAKEILASPGLNPSASNERGTEETIAQALRLQLRYPFLDRGVVPFLARLAKGPRTPSEALRELVKTMDLPPEFASQAVPSGQ